MPIIGDGHDSPSPPHSAVMSIVDVAVVFVVSCRVVMTWPCSHCCSGGVVVSVVAVFGDMINGPHPSKPIPMGYPCHALYMKCVLHKSRDKYLISCK